MLCNTFINRVLYKSLWLALLPLCFFAAVVDAAKVESSTEAPARQSRELPTEWNGQALRPLALSEVEMRFAASFPGTISRMTDDREVLVLRNVNRPTRMLHPAADCYQGLGYRIDAQQLVKDQQNQLWRCFEATRAGQGRRVCERIVDANGQGFTDASAWYWSAMLGKSQGPWQAITVASAL